jgi:hypothetical protein
MALARSRAPVSVPQTGDPQHQAVLLGHEAGQERLQQEPGQYRRLVVRLQERQVASVRGMQAL